MSRILGIDHGEAKIGLAVSDKTQTIANSFKYLKNDNNLFDELEKIVNEKEISEIVIGLPLMLSGEDSIQTQKVREFKEELEQALNIKTEFIDERLSTSYAEKILISGNVRRKKRKEKIDSLSAQILLQNYLDKKK
jgi:putative Holliday junction resolvase